MKNNKTIGITLRFWTNDLEVKRHNEIVNSCWSSGFAFIEANKQKGIKSISKKFDNLSDIPEAIRYVLDKSKVKVVN